MSKSAIFSRQPIFSQILHLISKGSIKEAARQYQSDRYYKKFKTKDHLVTMLYTIFHRCSSLREVRSGMQVCYGKLHHSGMDYCPRKSTLSDANKKRSSAVFESIYRSLYQRDKGDLPDSRKRNRWLNRLYIIDSTTISLFKEILKNAGRKHVNGKRKDGIKVHTMIKADEDIPCLLKMSAAASHDLPFIRGLKLPKGSIVVFDKGYNHYSQYELWTKEGVNWVTRARTRTVFQIQKSENISEAQKKEGNNRRSQSCFWSTIT